MIQLNGAVDIIAQDAFVTACVAILTLICIALSYSKHTFGRSSCQAQVDKEEETANSIGDDCTLCDTYPDEEPCRAAGEAESLVQQHNQEPGRRSVTSTGSLAERMSMALSSAFNEEEECLAPVEECMSVNCLEQAFLEPAFVEAYGRAAPGQPC